MNKSYKYAQIIYGKVYGIFEYPWTTEEMSFVFAPSELFIPIDNLEIKPEVGWGYNLFTNNFVEPEKPPEPPTLEELKQQKVNLFKSYRDTEEISIIDYNNNKFDYDDKSRERMRIAEKALVDNNLTSQLWTCADNTQTTLTVDDFKNINTVAAQRSALLHTKYNGLKISINVSESKEELAKIEWV